MIPGSRAHAANRKMHSSALRLKAEGLNVDEYTIGLIKGAIALLRKMVDMDEPPNEVTREGAQAVADQLQDFINAEEQKSKS